MSQPKVRSTILRLGRTSKPWARSLRLSTSTTRPRASNAGWHLHFIPTRSSWLNRIDRWFARITHERLRLGVFQSVPQLVGAIGAYIAEHNRQPRQFVWTASAELHLGKVSHLFNQLRCHHPRVEAQ